MPNARDIIESSLRLIGVLASGETSSADEADDGRSILNDLIETLSNERLMIFEVTRDEYTLIANTNPHTIGSGGNINANRPERIEGFSIIPSGQDIEIPGTILTWEQWQAIPDKTVTSTIPYYLWYEPSVALGNIWLFPEPSAAATIVLYTWLRLSSFSDLTTNVNLPLGYGRMLRYNLAVDLAPEYGARVDPQIFEIARQSKAALKNLNAPLLDLRCDDAVVNIQGPWDYRIGEYRRR